jgi:archaellum biogenesis protein FlaJ (TadC family)
MNPKQTTVSIIIVSIVFAIAIVMASIIMDDSEHSNTVTLILIAIWFIPFTYLIQHRIPNPDQK